MGSAGAVVTAFLEGLTPHDLVWVGVTHKNGAHVLSLSNQEKDSHREIKKTAEYKGKETTLITCHCISTINLSILYSLAHLILIELS